MSERNSICHWGSFPESVYSLIARLMSEDESALINGDVRLSTLPCLCALAAYAVEHGHTCMPLSSIAGKTISAVIDLLRSTENTRGDDEDLLVRSIVLPECEGMISVIVAHPEIVFNADSPTTGSFGCPPFVLRGDLLMLRRYDLDERYLSALIERMVDERMTDALVRNNGLLPCERAMFTKKDSPNDFDGEKIAAAEKMLSNRFSILNGGPGTGKTFTLARVMACALKCRPEMRILLAAPSAKAAARMKQSIMQSRTEIEGFLGPEGCEKLFGGDNDAHTVDKLLSKDADFVNYRRCEDSPLEADWVIIDEASMLSLPMAVAIIKALPAGCRLTFVGDYNQLSSVDLGHVFADLCARFGGSVSTLLTSNRFEDGGPVDRLAKTMLGEEVSAGATPADAVIDLLRDPEFSQTIKWHSISGDTNVDANEWKAFDSVVRSGFATLLKCREDGLGAVRAIGEFSVLSAMRHHRKMGCQALNRRILDCLSEGQGGIPSVNLVTQNVYDPTRLCNGDSFVVLPADKQTAVLQSPDGSITEIALSLIPQHEIAFAETVHKVQGSEFNRIAIVLSDQADSPLLTREMLYTAVTRVKKGGRVDIWGSEASIRKCVMTPTNRFTPYSCQESRV